MFDHEVMLNDYRYRINDFFGTLSTIRERFDYRVKSSKTAEALRQIENKARKLAQDNDLPHLIQHVDMFRTFIYSVLNNILLPLPRAMP